MPHFGEKFLFHLLFRTKKAIKQALGSQSKTRISELQLRNAKEILEKITEGERESVFLFFQVKAYLTQEPKEVKKKGDQKHPHPMLSAQFLLSG